MADLETIMNAVGWVSAGLGLWTVISYPFAAFSKKEYIFPWKKVDDYVYEMRQLFNNWVYRPLGGSPRLAFHLVPLFKMTRDEKGDIARVTARVQEEDTFVNFITADGLPGRLRLQYRWCIPDGKGANRFYWKLKPPRADQVNNAIIGKMTEQIGLVDGAPEIDKKTGKILKVGLSGKTLDIGVSVKDYLNNRRNGDNLYALTGAEVVKMIPQELEFDEAPGKILSKVADAIQEATAKIIKSEAEVEEQKNYAVASAGLYKPVFALIKTQTQEAGLNLSNEEIDRRTREIMRNVSNLQVAQEKGTVILDTTTRETRPRLIPFPSQSSPPTTEPPEE